MGPVTVTRLPTRSQVRRAPHYTLITPSLRPHYTLIHLPFEDEEAIRLVVEGGDERGRTPGVSRQ